MGTYIQPTGPGRDEGQVDAEGGEGDEAEIHPGGMVEELVLVGSGCLEQRDGNRSNSRFGNISSGKSCRENYELENMHKCCSKPAIYCREQHALAMVLAFSTLF